MNSILAQLRFHALDMHSRQLPQFREGQIFHGTVLKLMRDDLAVIDISRHPVAAKLEASLQSGHEYWFVVKKNGETPTLQVLSSISHHNDRPHSYEQSVQSLLRQLGLPSNSTNAAIVSNFQKKGIPFSKSLILTIASFLQTTPVARGLDVVNLMIERKLPMNAQVFQAIHRFVTADQPLLTELEEIINALQKDPVRSLRVQQLSGRLAAFMHKWESAFKSVSASSSSQQTQTFSAALQQLLSSFGLQYEKSLMKAYAQQTLSQENEQLHQELKPILLALLKENLPASTKQPIHDVVQRLTGQQLLMKFDDQMLQFLMQIPISKHDGMGDAHLHFQSKSKDGQIDADFCRILFYLQLPKLKETIVDVRIQNRIIAITVYNENQLSSHMLKPFISKLREQLKQSSYTLSSVKWVKAPKANLPTDERLFTSFPAMHRYEGVDIKI